MGAQATMLGLGASGLNANQTSLLTKRIRELYVKGERFLNLKGVTADPVLASLGINFNSPSIVPVMTLCGTLVGKECQTLSLEACGIVTLQHIANMFRWLPNLANLSLQDNSIAGYAELNHIRRSRLKQLILTGNAVALAGQVDPQGYVAGVRQYLPELEGLDGVPLPALEPVAVLGGAGGSGAGQPVIPLPPSIPSYACDPAVKKIAEDFLTKFYSILDGEDRTKLADAYSEEACMFSLTAAGPPPTVKVSAAWQKFAANDRNHWHKMSMAKKVEKLSSGRQAVVAELLSLPAVRHDPTAMGYDVIVTGGGAYLLVNVHGVFAEVAHGGKAGGADDKTVLGPRRAFTRSFLLVNVPPGSAAAAAGWPVVIRNDQMSIRYTVQTNTRAEGAGHKGRRGGAGGSGGSGGGGINGQPPRPATGLTPADEIATQTGLSAADAASLLMQSGGNVQQALHNYALFLQQQQQQQ